MGTLRGLRVGLTLLVLVALVATGCPKKTPASSGKPQVRPEPKPPATLAPAAPAPSPEASPVSADVREKLGRVDGILETLSQRSLTDAEGEERDAGAAFVAQSRQALEAGDADRALVLAEKALVLMEDLERATRP